jgi:hypothetical protein
MYMPRIVDENIFVYSEVGLPTWAVLQPFCITYVKGTATKCPRWVLLSILPVLVLALCSLPYLLA